MALRTVQLTRYVTGLPSEGDGLPRLRVALEGLLWMTMIVATLEVAMMISSASRAPGQTHRPTSCTDLDISRHPCLLSPRLFMLLPSQHSQHSPRYGEEEGRDVDDDQSHLNKCMAANLQEFE